MHRLEPLSPSGASVGDFGSHVRDQGNIASCASFSFLGLLENQMFNDRGITPDLSERYMIYSNFLQTGTLGGDPAVIAQFPQLTANIGVMNEELYPYEGVAKNYSRFDQDAAQGLEADGHQVLLGDAVKDTAPMSKARSTIIEGPDYCGALPSGAYPVQLPFKATLEPGAKVPQVEFGDAIYDCFATDPSTKKRLAVTPVEALKMCFDLEPAQYFTCPFDAAAAGAEAEAAATETDPCAAAKHAAAVMASKQYAANKQGLEIALGLLEAGDAVMLGVTAPASPRNVFPVWSTKTLELGGGHAVIAVGYASWDDLNDVAQQKKGILANGMFDKLDAMVEAGHMEKIAAAPDDAAKMQIRVQSALGQRMKDEGGLILFRNSWGAKVGDISIGVDGHQAMTFDWFMKTGMLIESRKEKRLGDLVAWNADNSCPAPVAFSLTGAWGKQPALDGLTSYWTAQATAGVCGTK